MKLDTPCSGMITPVFRLLTALLAIPYAGQLGFAGEVDIKLPAQGTLTLSMPPGWTCSAGPVALYSPDGSATSNHWNVAIQGTNNTRLGLLPSKRILGPEEVEHRIRGYYEILGGETNGITFVTHTNDKFQCSYYFWSMPADHWTHCNREAHGAVYIDTLIATFTGFFAETNDWMAAIHILETAHFESDTATGP